MARNSLLCADVPLRNYSLTHSLLLYVHFTLLLDYNNNNNNNNKFYALFWLSEILSYLS